MLFISHEEWMRRTYSRVYRRSPALKALDEALKEAGEARAISEVPSWYSEELWGDKMPAVLRVYLIHKVRDAFNKWVGSRVDDWRTSGRNSDGAVTELYNQLVYHIQQEPVPKSEKEALDLVLKARNESIPLLFKGCWVSSKRGTLQKLKDKRAKTKLQIDAALIVQKTGVHEYLYQIYGMIEGVIEEAFGATLAQLKAGGEAGGNSAAFADVAEVLAGQLKSLLVDVAPIVGMVPAVGKVISGSLKLYKVGNAYDDLFKMSLRLPEGSDPKAAIDAMLTWQRQEIARTTSKVARSAAKVAADLSTGFSGGTSYPVQAGIAIANAALDIVEILQDLGAQYRSQQALTAHLNSPQLDRQILAQSPLAAAIYMLNVDTSTVALCFVDMGAPAWREEWTIIQKYGPFNTLITESARVIESSRYEIHRMGDPFRTREGKKKAVKMKEAVGMKPLRGKVKMDAMGSNDMVGPV